MKSSSQNNIMGGSTAVPLIGGGAKCSDVYADSGSALVDLSVALVRGLSPSLLQEHVLHVAAECDAREKSGRALSAAELWEDAVVLAFQTRDVRGGKGERDLFHELFFALRSHRPDVVDATLSFIPHFGYWKDVAQLAAATAPGAEHSDPALFDALVTLMLNALKQDEARIASGDSTGISLVAKYLPREKGNNAAMSSLAAVLADRLAPGDTQRHKLYRKRVSAVNKALGTVEIAMCSARWAGINPGTVPGRALRKYNNAFFNLPIAVEREGLTVSKHSSRTTVLTSTDRIACAANFSGHMQKAATGEEGFTVKGGNVIFPHELVKAALKFTSSGGTSGGGGVGNDDLRNVLEAQWRSVVARAKAGSGAASLGRMIPMCDVSGSMTGDPMLVSIALGLLISECLTGAFANTVITFDSNPTLVELKGTCFVDRVAELAAIPWGGSTDFQAAYQLLLTRLAELRVPVGEEPSQLICLTDMCFDAARGSRGSMGFYGAPPVPAGMLHYAPAPPPPYGGGPYPLIGVPAAAPPPPFAGIPPHMFPPANGTYYTYGAPRNNGAFESHASMIQRAFAELNAEVHGPSSPGYAVPLLVVWNLRSKQQRGLDLQATADEPGVIQISGWAPSMLDTLVDTGALPEAPLEDGAPDKSTVAFLRKQLDAERYDELRTRLRGLRSPAAQAEAKATAAPQTAATQTAADAGAFVAIDDTMQAAEQ